MKKNTVYINIYGAPCSGKSTFATGLFSELKRQGYDCEYVPEFAKSMIWTGNCELFENPENQFYICANQFYALNCLKGKVDVVITDSPILLSCVYNRSNFLGDEYDLTINHLDESLGEHKINILLNRDESVPYNQNGRNEDETHSRIIQTKIRNLLDNFGIEFCEFAMVSTFIPNYFETVKQLLNERKGR